MKTGFKRFAITVLGSALILLLSTSLATAAIVADFDDGNTTGSVDGYPGMAGNGWNSAWSTHGSNVTVLNTQPLNAGGNYLSMTVPSGTAQYTLNRKLDRPNTMVDLTAEHVISFDYRIDDISAYALDGYAGTGASAIRLVNADSTSPNDGKHTWYLGAFNRPNSPISGGAWHLRDGTGVTTGVTLVSTGILPAQGVTYSFTFHVFPEDSQYRFVLTDSNGNSWDSDDPGDYGARLNFRNADPLLRAGDFLIFDMQKPADAVSGSFTYSLDNLQIIPEPGTLALMLSAMGLAALSRRRVR